MIVGSVLIAAGLIIMIPSILYIYSGITSITTADIVRATIEAILGRFGIGDGAEASISYFGIALSVVGLVVSPVLLVDGIIALIGGGILLFIDRRKLKSSAGPDLDSIRSEVNLLREELKKLRESEAA